MAEWYDYREVLYWDIYEALKCMDDIAICEENYDEIYDRLWEDDNVTGNGNCSYTCNTYQAEENLCHNWGLLREAFEELGCDDSPLERGPEYCDVIIRLYLLREVLDRVLNDWEEETEGDSND